MSGHELFQTPWNFLGLPEDVSDPERARGWLLPIPYESTTSYGAGTREGPAAILAASRQVELYDREFGNEPAMEYGIHTTLPLNLVHRSPEAMIQSVEEAVAELLSGKQRPEVLGVLGGEHSISAGVVAWPGARSESGFARRCARGRACGHEGGIRRLSIQPRVRGKTDSGSLPDISDRHPQSFERRGGIPAPQPQCPNGFFGRGDRSQGRISEGSGSVCEEEAGISYYRSGRPGSVDHAGGGNAGTGRNFLGADARNSPNRHCAMRRACRFSMWWNWRRSPACARRISWRPNSFTSFFPTR